MSEPRASSPAEPPEPLDRRRGLPAIGRLLEAPAVRALAELYGRERVRVQAQQEIEALRRVLQTGAALTPPMPESVVEAEVNRLPQRIAAALESELGAGLRRVLNATGVLLHTNLGRAPLPAAVAAGLPALLDAYCDLELDLTTGKRSRRNRWVERLLVALTGTPAALVVNNNAAALVLALHTLARGREVLVSRGELVEIGGSFRIPQILEAAGARLVEVGTTNRTRLSDYESALSERTALLLKVFPSNYRMTGFVEAAPLLELVELGRRAGLPLLVDEGSGLLRPHPELPLPEHPSLSELALAGVDLACGSGDKLLGGPQAGILSGRAELIERCHRNPLYRALRPDRAALAALEGVLRHHLAGKPLPLDRLLAPPSEHRPRLLRAQARLGGEIVPAEAFLGGGAGPEQPIAGEALALRALEGGEDELLQRLRLGDPPVVGYLRSGRLILDLRTVDPVDDEALLSAAERALVRPGSPR